MDWWKDSTQNEKMLEYLKFLRDCCGSGNFDPLMPFLSDDPRLKVSGALWNLPHRNTRIYPLDFEWRGYDPEPEGRRAGLSVRLSELLSQFREKERRSEIRFVHLVCEQAAIDIPEVLAHRASPQYDGYFRPEPKNALLIAWDTDYGRWAWTVDLNLDRGGKIAWINILPAEDLHYTD